MLVIGIIGDQGVSAVAEIVGNELEAHGMRVRKRNSVSEKSLSLFRGSENTKSGRKAKVNEYTSMKVKTDLNPNGNRNVKANAISNADESADVVIVRLNRKRLKKSSFAPETFDAIVCMTLACTCDAMEFDMLEGIPKSIKRGGYLIHSGGEVLEKEGDSSLDTGIGRNNFYEISYGLSKECAITVSSVDEIDSTSFQYCLQKYLINSQKQLLEPFECSVLKKWNNIPEEYYLAAYTCMLVMGYKF